MRALARDEMVARAKQLYEEAWSGGRVRVLDAIMAEGHRQVDVVWQPDNTGGGRRRLKRGILAYRAAYPDICFTVEHVAVVEGAPKVFVSWRAAGTNLGPIRDQPPSGRRVEFRGVTLVTFDADGLIEESAVFRQAPDDEARYFGGASAGAAAGGAHAAAEGGPSGGAADGAGSGGGGAGGGGGGGRNGEGSSDAY